MQNILLSRFNSVVPKVKLNTPIKSIDHNGEIVTVVDKNNETTTVNKVIVTVPVSILKEGGIQFSPALPANKTTALTKIGMDASVHVSLEFKKNIWNETSAFIFGGNTAPSYFSSSLSRSDANKFLNITINGPAAENLSALGDGMIEAILQELDDALNGQASLNISKDLNGNIISVIRDWTKEEFIKGGMSYNKPGGTNADREAMAESINEKVFFAGEATDIVGDFGTITGALQSAERSANEVLESIKT
jgi:monoamine oxidase